VGKETPDSTAPLIDFTLYGHHRSHYEVFGIPVADLAIVLVQYYTVLVETCCSSLDSQEVKALVTSPSPNLQYTPLTFSSVPSS